MNAGSGFFGHTADSLGCIVPVVRLLLEDTLELQLEFALVIAARRSIKDGGVVFCLHAEVNHQGGIAAIIEDYTREAGVRGLKKRMDQLCRSAAVTLVDDENAKLTVTPSILPELMDMSPLRRKSVPESAKPGIVTGLAWTPVGGDILYIQTLLTKGSGKITVTGQLGDVMKESAQIAVSLVKAMLPEQAQILAESDLHIHVPDGATPKDGPSAGITLTTALASQLTGVSVPPNVAMTGEVSLQGDVNPIGGLPEKLMAAQRSGVKQVFIPKENIDNLKDVAEEVRQAVEITPVSSVQEVLLALEIPVKSLMSLAG